MKIHAKLVKTPELYVQQKTPEEAEQQEHTSKKPKDTSKKPPEIWTITVDNKKEAIRVARRAKSEKFKDGVKPSQVRVINSPLEILYNLPYEVLITTHIEEQDKSLGKQVKRQPSDVQMKHEENKEDEKNNKNSKEGTSE